MGFGVTELIIVLVIVILLFGTKKLRSLGGDLGGALKSFRGAMKDDDNIKPPEDMDHKEQVGVVIEDEADKTPSKNKQ